MGVKTKIREAPKRYQASTLFLAFIAVCEVLELIMMVRGR